MTEGVERYRRGAALAKRAFPFVGWMRGLTLATVRADMVAGLTGAIIVLPQGVAYALIAGLPPVYGLYSAIVPTIVAALYGSSRHNITGPTAANSIVVLALIAPLASPDGPDYIPMVLALTFLVGVFQLALGLLRLGVLVNFISDSVVVGFTAGAAMLIAVSQLKHVFQLDLANDLTFYGTLVQFAAKLPNSNPYAVVIAAVTLGVTLVVRRLRPRWPAMIIGMVAGAAASQSLGGRSHDVELVGALSGSLPPLSMPPLGLETLRELASPAVAVGILALVQAISAARAVATRSGQKIDGNQEFIGQGLANLVGSLFSSYACSGSFTRSGANYDAGARTPLAGILAAFILALVLIAAPGITRYLPMPAMGGIVLLIAWNLIAFDQIWQTLRASRTESAVLFITLLATLFLPLQFAIYAGVLLSLVLYLRRTAHPRMVAVAPVPGRSLNVLRNADKRGLAQCGELRMIRIDGSLFFGAVDHVQTELRRITEAGYRHVLLVGSGVNFIDLAGARMLAREAERLRALGGGLYLCSFKDPAREELKHDIHRQAVGEMNFFASPQEAIKAIVARVGAPDCPVCHGGPQQCVLLESPDKPDLGQGAGDSGPGAARD